jgi:hypothetical protein
VSSTTIALAAIPVAVVAVVLSTGGMSLGLTKEAKGEVEVLTIATGSFTTPAQYPDSIAISNTVFTQEAGTTLLVLMRASMAICRRSRGGLPARSAHRGVRRSRWLRNRVGRHERRVQRSPSVEGVIANG